MMELKNRKILIGVTGSIAAYKIAELVHQLRLQNAEIKVILTDGAQEFIAPLTFQALSGQPVFTKNLNEYDAAGMNHIQLARWADLVLIAPASANCIARLACGMANDLLTTVCLATTIPIFVAPAMNQQMWANHFVQENINKLKKNNVTICGPAEGIQACGDKGAGRMLESIDLLKIIKQFFNSNLYLTGENIVITAGPTREAIDAVRFISNYSSGKMGYALAIAAKNAGANVCLISGPTALAQPEGIEFIAVETAKEMHDAVIQKIKSCSIFIATAAVADYRVAYVSKEKIKKTDQALNLELIPNVDILAEVTNLSDCPFVIGFAAETSNLENFAQIKLQQKKMDMVVANYVGQEQGFNVDDNAAIVLTKTGKKISLSLQSKFNLAQEILALLHEELQNKLLVRNV